MSCSAVVRREVTPMVALLRWELCQQQGQVSRQISMPAIEPANFSILAEICPNVTLCTARSQSGYAK
jgi:hypothetical protein